MILIVPVKPHVKEFFQNSHMLGNEAIAVRRNSRIGQVIAAVFCAYPLQDVDLDDLEPADLLAPDRLHFTTTFELNPSLITDLRLAQLGIMLEVIFEFFAIAFCQGRMDVYPSLNGAAERFTDRYKIGADSYSPDAIRKMVDRSSKESDTVYNKLSVREKRSVGKLMENKSCPVLG